MVLDDPQTQAMLVTLVNAVGSMIVFKLKQYKDRASASARRADAIAAAVDEALRDDGTISKTEIARIKRVAERAAGA